MINSDEEAVRSGAAALLRTIMCPTAWFGAGVTEPGAAVHDGTRIEMGTRTGIASLDAGVGGARPGRTRRNGRERRGGQQRDSGRELSDQRRVRDRAADQSAQHAAHHAARLGRAGAQRSGAAGLAAVASRVQLPVRGGLPDAAERRALRPGQAGYPRAPDGDRLAAAADDGNPESRPDRGRRHRHRRLGRAATRPRRRLGGCTAGARDRDLGLRDLADRLAVLSRLGSACSAPATGARRRDSALLAGHRRGAARSGDPARPQCARADAGRAAGVARAPWRYLVRAASCDCRSGPARIPHVPGRPAAHPAGQTARR